MSDRINGFGIGDAGNTYGFATDVALNIEGDAAIAGFAGFGADRDDYYRFVAPASGAAHFRLDDLNQDLDLSLYSSSGFLLAQSNTDGAVADAFTFYLVEENSYYLRVDPYHQARSAYSLSIDAAGAGSDDYIDGLSVGDAGNSRESATRVGLDGDGDAVIWGVAGVGGDGDDYFSFVAGATGVASFTLSGLEQDLDLSLYGAGEFLRGSNEAGTEADSFSFDVVAGETYLLRVDPFMGDHSRYSLTIETPRVEGRSDVVDGTVIGDAGDGIAMGDVFALDINGDLTMTGSVGFADDGGDFYSFVAAGSGVASFTLGGLDQDVDIGLYSSSGDELASSTSGGTTAEVLDYNLVGGTSYILGVEPYLDAESDYTLSIDVQDAASRVVMHDPNNDGILCDALLLTSAGETIDASRLQLYRTYKGALGREPDEAGFAWWTQQFESGECDLEALVDAFINSQEFVRHFDGAEFAWQIDERAFVGHMYENVLDRSPDASGLEFWVDELESGARSRAEVLVDMTQSNEYVELTLCAATDYLVG